MRCTLLLTALLLVGALPLDAQVTAGEYRTPVRRVRVDSLNATYVFYTVLQSDATPSTVGRRYRASYTTWKSYGYILEGGPALLFSDSFHIWPRRMTVSPGQTAQQYAVLWFTRAATGRSVPTVCADVAGTVGWADITLTATGIAPQPAADQWIARVEDCQAQATLTPNVPQAPHPPPVRLTRLTSFDYGKH